MKRVLVFLRENSRPFVWLKGRRSGMQIFLGRESHMFAYTSTERRAQKIHVAGLKSAARKKRVGEGGRHRFLVSESPTRNLLTFVCRRGKPHVPC